MMSRILVAAGLLYVAHSEVESTNLNSKSGNQASAAGAKQQHQQQQEQQTQKYGRKYVDEYVPAAYRKSALRDVNKEGQRNVSKESQNQHKQDSAVDNGAVTLLQMPDASSKSSSGSSQSQSGNYQQYMNKYAGGNQGGSQSGDYQQYMKKYAGGSQGGSQSGDYQQYMKKYAGGSQGGSQAGDYQQYMKKYAGGSQGGSQSQSGNYQQYMKKYAGGDKDDASAKHQAGEDVVNLLEVSKGSSDQGSSSNYQQYMNKYAGGSEGGSNYKQYYQNYMNKYAGHGDSDYSKYADYEKYIHRYNNHEQANVVRSAHDAQNMSQLDAWRDQSKQNVQWYVPAQYGKYANRNVDRQYNERMRQLGGGSTTENLDTSFHTDSSLKSPFADVLNLDALPADKKAQAVAHLKEAAEAEVKKAEQLGSSLKDAATDRNAIAMVAARPAHNVVAAFNARAKSLENEIGNLQQQVKSQTTSADFEKQLHQCTEKVAHLRGDELHALDQAHREANQAARHAAQGSQTEVRHEARQVWALSDRMAKADDSYQDLSNQLQNRVEKAADFAENNCEELARHTQDHLENNLEHARDTVRKESDRRMDTLREVRHQFTELEAAQKSAQSGSYTFLAQSVGVDTADGSILLVFGALFGVMVSFIAFFKRSTHRVSLPSNMLG